MEKDEQLQLLIDLTGEYINEMALSTDLSVIDPVELFKDAVAQAIVQYQFVTNTTRNVLPVGRVDTETVAFQLQDKETTAILQGPANFLEGTEFDSFGGEEPSLLGLFEDEEF